MSYLFRGQHLAGLGAAYSVPITRPDFGTPVIYLPQANGRWFITFSNPNGTQTGMYQNTNATLDPNFVDPPDSVWKALGVVPDYKANPAKLTGDIKAADFYALNPINPASFGPTAAVHSSAPAQGASMQSKVSPAFSLPGGIEVPALPWWALALGAAGLAWFAFGKGGR